MDYYHWMFNRNYRRLKKKRSQESAKGIKTRTRLHETVVKNLRSGMTIETVVERIMRAPDKEKSVDYLPVILGKLSSDIAISGLAILLRNGNADLRKKSIEEIGKVNPDMLFNLLCDARVDVRENVILVLGKMQKQIVFSSLIRATEDEELTIRKAAISALGFFDSDESLSELMFFLNEEASELRCKTVSSLTKMSSGRSIAVLWSCCKEPRQEGKYELTRSIALIQSNCKFYNYEIYQQAAELRKADRPSLEGGGGDPSFATIDRKLDNYHEEVRKVTDQPKYGSKYAITGNPTIVEGNMEVKGDNVGTKNIHNYFGTDEALQKQITDLQTFITELEAQHPNIQTEEQANQLVQQKLGQIQTQNPDRWQKLRHQMGILKAQFFNPERHVQAFKATVVEVTKAKWEESLIVKAIVTY